MILQYHLTFLFYYPLNHSFYINTYYTYERGSNMYNYQNMPIQNSYQPNQMGGNRFAGGF